MSKNKIKFMGRKFRQIKVIDYIAFLFLVAIGFFFLFRFKRVSKPLYVELTFQRNQNNRMTPPEYWQINKIQLNDTIISSLGEPVGEVEEINFTPWGGGQRRQYKILVRLDSLKTLRPGTYSFEGNPVYVGSELTLNTGQEKFAGTVINIFDDLSSRYDGFEKKDAVVKVKARGYESWVVESMNEFELINNRGFILAEMIDLISKPSERAEVNSRGQLVLTQHPFLKDMEITFKLHDVLCQENSCYFNDFFTFMIGQEFWVDNGHVAIGYNTSIMSVELIGKE